jgi:hypothetical protein
LAVEARRAGYQGSPVFGEPFMLLFVHLLSSRDCQSLSRIVRKFQVHALLGANGQVCGFKVQSAAGRLLLLFSDGENDTGAQDKLVYDTLHLPAKELGDLARVLVEFLGGCLNLREGEQLRAGQEIQIAG